VRNAGTIFSHLQDGTKIHQRLHVLLLAKGDGMVERGVVNLDIVTLST
jgi:hypothetical protein